MEQQFNKCPNVECECGNMYIPIQSVDGIECDARIQRNKQGVTTLILDTRKNLVKDDEDDAYIYYHEDVTLETVGQVLSSLRFNRYRNKFQTKPIFDWSFLESETVKVHDKCVVCYERTGSKTTCGHQLCIPCYDKVKYTEEKETHCPMCRTDCYIT
jgi:hypothetical protein